MTRTTATLLQPPQFLGMGDDNLAIVVTFLHENDLFPVKLVCKALHNIVVEAVGARTKTAYASAYDSVEKFEWAYALGQARRKHSVCHFRLALAAKMSRLDVRVLERAVRSFRRFKGGVAANVCTGVCVAAAAAGKLDVLDWACENGGVLTAVTFSAAAGAGHHHVLDALRARGCPVDNSACAAAAASHGRVNTLAWLRRHINPCPWDETACAAAAANGHLIALQWLRKMCASWDHETCASAARGGHLRVLDWAFHAGCPLPGWPCVREIAAERGDLATFTWAREHEHLAPISRGSVELAAIGGDVRIMQYMVDDGCARPDSAILAAAQRGNREMMQFLLENGWKWCPRIADVLGINGHRELREWALQNGCPPGTFD